VTFSAGQRADAADFNLTGQTLSALCGAGTTTSASYANMAATSSTNLTKASAATRLRIEFACTTFVTTTGSTVTQFGVLVNGTDYDISRMFFNPVSTHLACPTGVVYISGLAANIWTVQARWKRVSGTGTCTTDVNDWITIDVQEVL
jgi:hypothetical protein